MTVAMDRLEALRNQRQAAEMERGMILQDFPELGTNFAFMPTDSNRERDYNVARWQLKGIEDDLKQINAQINAVNETVVSDMMAVFAAQQSRPAAPALPPMRQGPPPPPPGGPPPNMGVVPPASPPPAQRPSRLRRIWNGIKTILKVALIVIVILVIVLGVRERDSLYQHGLNGAKSVNDGIAWVVRDVMSVKGFEWTWPWEEPKPTESGEDNTAPSPSAPPADPTPEPTVAPTPAPTPDIETVANAVADKVVVLIDLDARDERLMEDLKSFVRTEISSLDLITEEDLERLADKFKRRHHHPTRVLDNASLDELEEMGVLKGEEHTPSLDELEEMGVLPAPTEPTGEANPSPDFGSLDP